MKIVSLLLTEVTKGLTINTIIKTSGTPNRRLLGRLPNIKHPTRAQRLAIEFLSIAGIISNLMATPAGNSKKAPKTVHKVACRNGLERYKKIAIKGQAAKTNAAKKLPVAMQMRSESVQTKVETLGH